MYAKSIPFLLIVYLLSINWSWNPSAFLKGASHDENGVYQTKNKLVGGPCEGCEAIFEYGNAKLNSIDTLPDFKNKGPKIKITGTVYKLGGKETVPNAILYVYHTNQKGIYPTRGDEKDWAKRHGFIRGWIKTNANGEYAFFTLKPGTYPSRTEPAHIHLTVLEPNGKYYWLNSYHFKGDPLLKENELSSNFPRGGNDGIISLIKKGSLLVGHRDIELGKNIPGYE